MQRLRGIAGGLGVQGACVGRVDDQHAGAVVAGDDAGFQNRVHLALNPKPQRAGSAAPARPAPADEPRPAPPGGNDTPAPANAMAERLRGLLDTRRPSGRKGPR